MTEHITPTELAKVRERHSEIPQEGLVLDGEGLGERLNDSGVTSDASDGVPIAPEGRSVALSGSLADSVGG